MKLEKSKFSIICNDLSHLSDFTRPIDTSVFRFLKSHLPGPFTFILEANKSLPLAYKGHKTIGIRVPDHPIPQLIVEKLGILLPPLPSEMMMKSLNILPILSLSLKNMIIW
jgi:tRNA A37 threonylcarbamoyladenosine synthetase subunit TsaC/SUA5/YrdC